MFLYKLRRVAELFCLPIHRQKDKQLGGGPLFAHHTSLFSIFKDHVAQTKLSITKKTDRRKTET